MKSIFLKIFLFTFSLLIGLLICELILKQFTVKNIISIDPNKSFANDNFTYSSSLKYRVKPYLVRNCTAIPNPKAICYSNYLGFRDKDHSFNKPNDTYRILLLGDSLTYGPGVNTDETYPKKFEKILNKEYKNKKIEIINMGMIFYGPEQYYNLYEEYGKKYNPDLVVVSYHLLTDPYDAYEYDLNRKSYFYKSIPDFVPYKVNQFLKEKSLLYRAFLSGYYGWANRQQVNVEKIVFNGKNNRYQYDTQLNTSSPSMKKGWEISEKYMNLLINSAKSNNSKISVIIFPTPAQILPNEWEKMKKEGYLSDQRLYSQSKTREKMLQLCRKYSWKCLDLQDPFRKSKNIDKLFLKKDIHLTGYGNEITANALLNYLKQSSLIN